MFKVNPPTGPEIGRLNDGATLVGLISPGLNPELVDALAYQLELVGLDLGTDTPGVDRTLMAAEAFLVEPWRHGWLLPFVMTAMPGGMALFFAAACALVMPFWLPGPGRVFALAIASGVGHCLNSAGVTMFTR